MGTGGPSGPPTHMRRVKFHRLVMSPVYGDCGPGDLLRCDDTFARHVVDDLGAAIYVDAVEVPVVEPEAVKKARTRKERAK